MFGYEAWNCAAVGIKRALSRVAPYASPFAIFLKAVDSGPQPGLGCRREGAGPLYQGDAP